MGAYWDDFISGILDYAIEGYSSLNGWEIPLFFCGLIAFAFFYTGSTIVAVVFILILMSVYGVTVFAEVPDLTLILYVIVIIGVAALITMLFIKRR